MPTMPRSAIVSADGLAGVLASVPVSRIADLLAADIAWRHRAAEQLAREIVNRLDQPTNRAANPRE
jgi:predicted regulator of Ras-like GTPase activity (Roadblock/LC7/MglB family)